MQLERSRHTLRVGLPEGAGALDVGEDEGHDAGGELDPLYFLRRRCRPEGRSGFCGRRGRSRERRVLREDRALELAQALARLDAELLDQLSPGVLERLEGVG